METSYLGDGGVNWLLFNGLNLALIHLYPLGRNPIPKEDNLWGEEVTLL